MFRPQGGGSGGGDYNQQYYEQYWNNYAAWQGYGGSNGGPDSQYYDVYASGPGGYAEYEQPAQQAGQEDKPTKEDFEPVGQYYFRCSWKYFPENYFNFVSWIIMYYTPREQWMDYNDYIICTIIFVSNSSHV